MERKIKKEIYEACRTIISHEDAFIDLAFEMGPLNGLTPDEVKKYIRWTAHIIEQHAANRLIRPLSKYKGEKHRKVVLLNQR